ncbi:hypothetical protein EDD21DRAFT_374338 [Dissophora ornata]|nr:hypothetical protein EDD21DRAFT_374338 [Dissophora ornata]
MPSGAIPFDKQEYWAQRFEHEPSFEWLMPWSVLEPRMRELNVIPTDHSAKILNLGCGNSDLPLDLYHSGYRHVTSVDFVGPVVDRMRERCEWAIGWKQESSSLPIMSPLVVSSPVAAVPIEPIASPIVSECPLQFLEMDCLDMSALPEQSFQLCLDKSTSDAISCGDDDNCTKLRTLCEQVARVVHQPGGLWCVISYSRFRQYEWTEGRGQGLWRTECIEEIKVEQVEQQQQQCAKSTAGSRHTVHVPEVFQYLYVNRRL